MLLLLMLIAVPVVFGAYSWYRHVFERECLALLREENALAAREARARYEMSADRDKQVLQLSGSSHRRA